MNNKQANTLKAIFRTPVNGNLEWNKIESLLLAIDCELVEGSGSLVKFTKNNEEIAIHRPHPSKDSLRYRVKLVKTFLIKIGVTSWNTEDL